MAWHGTPEDWKPKMEGPFKPGTHRPQQQYIKKGRTAKVRVEEPVMKLLDEAMYKHGVSSKRLEETLGLGDGRLKDMRRFNTAWAVMKVARQCLWLMGYDLQVKLVRVGPPDISVVMTKAQRDAKDLAKINGRKVGWDSRKMWVWLGIDKL